VIIVKKFGNSGGNIYVNPGVGTIRATLIADGALMNRASTSNTSLHWLNEVDRSTLDDKKLTIDGRLFTYNSRGGSLYIGNYQLTGYAFDAENAKCFTSSATAINCLGSTAASQDLERFRLTTTPPTVASNQCTLYVTGRMLENLPILSNTPF
jgi:hypothetical protein